LRFQLALESAVKPNFSQKARDASRSLTVKLIENTPRFMVHSFRRLFWRFDQFWEQREMCDESLKEASRGEKIYGE
jgi:hypothetical protein